MDWVRRSDAPHLTTILPEWRELPFACRMLSVFAATPESNWYEIEFLDTHENRNKVGRVFQLFRSHVDVLNDDGSLTQRGQVLEAVYDPPFDPEDPVKVEEDEELDLPVRVVLWTILYHEHAVPMLAAVHQLHTETVPDRQTDRRAYSHFERVRHLESYRDDVAASSHKFRAKVHFEWLVQLKLARVSNDYLELEPCGEALFDQCRDEVPEQWRVAPENARKSIRENELAGDQTGLGSFSG